MRGYRRSLSVYFVAAVIPVAAGPVTYAAAPPPHVGPGGGAHSRSTVPEPAISFFSKLPGKSSAERVDFLLVGERVTTRLTNLPPGKTVTLRATENGCESKADFVVGKDGT